MNTSSPAVRVNLSYAFHNKENLTRDDSAFGNSFNPVTIGLSELATHIASGNAFTLHSFKHNRRIGTEWDSAQLVGLDLDECLLSAIEIASLPDIRDNAWLVYPSPSSTPQKPKTRILFVLPSAVVEPKRWQPLQLALMAHFADLNPDKACKDLARLFYGSTQSGHILLGNVASWEWLSGLCLPLATADYEKTRLRPQEKPRAVISGSRAEKYAQAAFNKALDELAGAGAGERNATLFKVSVQLQSMVLGGWPGLDNATIRSAIQSIYVHWENVPKSEKTMENGFKVATPKLLELPTNPLKSAKSQRESIELPEAAILAPFTADRTFSSRYVSNAPDGVLDATCIALKSPTGSGKTQWAAADTADAPSLLTIAFRQSLVRSQADLYGATVYDALDGQNSYLIASANRISTTIDSLHKFAGRVFHTIVIDEWASLLGHFSSAGTLREKAAGTWELLQWLITHAERVIVMDAHLTNNMLAGLKALRGDLICIENTYIQPKVPTQLLPNSLAFYSTALGRVKVAVLPVLIGVTSPATARLIKDLIGHFYPDKQVRVITVKQSHLIDTQAFIGSINAHLYDVDVLIFNGAMSTGVSIDLAVDSIICMVDRPLAPADGVQMVSRARDTPMRFMRVPDTMDGLQRDAAEIFQNMELGATLTDVETTKPVRSLGRLRAQHEARRNTDMANFLPMFRAYCLADGSETQAAVVPYDAALAEVIKVMREAYTEQERAEVLDTTHVLTITSDRLADIRKEGVQEITPEIDAGYLRHKIESATAQPVTGPLFDRYHVSKARDTLNRVDSSTGQYTHEIDQRENTDNLPLHQRSNATGIQALLIEGLQQLGVKALAELPVALNAVSAEAFIGFNLWAIQNNTRFAALLDYRGGHDGDLVDPVKAVRFFLKRFGVTLIRKQRMIAGKRFMQYSVDAQEIADQNAIIVRRRRKAAEGR